MKKQLIIWLALSAALMLLYPLATVLFAPPEAAMGLCILLFYMLAPAFSIAAGIFAGRNIRSLWCLPMLPSIFFILGTWLCFEMGETDFLLYAAVYLCLGVGFMLLSMLFQRKHS